MRTVTQRTLQPNTGWAGVVKKGQRIRVSGSSAVNLVVFDHSNLRERFDDSRTRGNPGKLFIGKGDHLLSKSNRAMMKIVEDSYTEGTHDLATGMCSGYSYRQIASLGRTGEYGRGIREVPAHGCWENLSEVLKPWNIRAEDISGPFNIFMTMEIDGKTGKLGNTAIRPSTPAHVVLEAEIDCLVGISACPDLMTVARPVEVLVYDN